MTTRKECDECNGTGTRWSGYRYVECPDCEGLGSWEIDDERD